MTKNQERIQSNAIPALLLLAPLAQESSRPKLQEVILAEWLVGTAGRHVTALEQEHTP